MGRYRIGNILTLFWDGLTVAKIVDTNEDKFRISRLQPHPYCDNYAEFTAKELDEMILEAFRLRKIW